MEPADIKGGELVRKHRLSTRLWHWINAASIIILLMSGLMISNAHPHLYWGHYGANTDTPWLSISWFIEGGRFPGWATIPSTYNLALARHWHLFFAWVFATAFLAWLIISLVNRHIQRDLTLTRAEIAPKHLIDEVGHHAKLQFPTGVAALRYNTLQKLTYVGVLFVLIPMMILTGICLQPGMSPLTGWAIELLGGRQSARSIHFICSGLVALFIVVHLLLVLLSGPYNQIRSMITGKFRVPHARSVNQPEPVGEGT